MSFQSPLAGKKYCFRYIVLNVNVETSEMPIGIPRPFSGKKNEHGNGRVVTTVEVQFVLMAGRETCQVNHYNQLVVRQHW